MMQRMFTFACVGLLAAAAYSSHAAMEASGKAAPLVPGRNVLAASA